MKIFTKKALLSYLVICFLILFSGCDKIQDVATFLPGKSSKQMKVYEEKITLPCTIKELGEDYQYADTFTTNGTDMTADVWYMGAPIFTVELMGHNDKGPNEESQIIGFTFENPKEHTFEVRGISGKTTEEQLVKKLGEPQNKLDGVENETSKTYFYNWDNKENQSLMTVTYANGIMSKIRTSYLPLKADDIKASPESNFDLDEVCKTVKLNKKKREFPISLKDLGKHYSFGKSAVPYQGSYIITELLYKGKLAMVATQEGHQKDKSANIVSLGSIEESKHPFEVSGIKRGSTVEEVREVLGDPIYRKETCQSQTGTVIEGIYIYREKDKGYLQITCKESKVSTMILSLIASGDNSISQ